MSTIVNQLQSLAANELTANELTAEEIDSVAGARGVDWGHVGIGSTIGGAIGSGFGGVGAPIGALAGALVAIVCDMI